jgi:hypothetical protein
MISTQASDMPMAPLPLIALLMVTLVGCVQEPVRDSKTATGGDALYLPPPPGVVGGDLRQIFIAPLTVSAREVTAAQGESLQRALERGIGLAVSDGTTFEVVQNPEEADLRLHADLLDAGEGAVTARLTLRNARTGDLLINAVETRATDILRAFDEAPGDHQAPDILFQSWGESLRSGLLELQGPVLPGSGLSTPGSP